MLLSLTVSTNSKQSQNVGTRLIRAEAVVGLITYATTGSEFDYPMNDRDRRVSLTHIQSTESVANVTTAMDLAYNAVSIVLPVHPDNLATTTPVNTTYNAGDIVWGAPYTPDASNKSWIYIQEGAFKVKKYLVNYTLAEVISLAGTGAP